MTGQWFYTNENEGDGIYRIEIDENKISPMPENDFEKGLTIPFSLDANSHWANNGIYITPLMFYANISYTRDNGLFRFADARPIINPSYNRSFNIPISLDKVEFVEKLRCGQSIKFVIDVDGIFAIKEKKQSGNNLFYSNPITKHLNIVIIIPKSTWEDSILPAMGIDYLNSITINIPSGLRKPLASSLKELSCATKTLEKASSESDFEAVVAKARITIESLINQFSLTLPTKTDGNKDTSFKTKVRAMCDQLISPILGKTQTEHIENTMISLWKPFSGAAHPSSLIFNRAYARFSIQQAASLLSIISETINSDK